MAGHGGLCLIALIVDIVLAAWVFLDARNRGVGSGMRLLWVVLAFFLSLLGLVIYIVARPNGIMARCGKCKNRVLKTLPNCPHCGNPAKRPPRQMPTPPPVHQAQQQAQIPHAQQPVPVPMPAARPAHPAQEVQQTQPQKEDIKCPNCGQNVDAEWKTCPHCSRKIYPEPTIIDEVFLMYRDGRLIRHFTRRLKPDVDQDILSGMLTAVQDFIKDSFRGETGELDEMKFGRFQIMMSRGRFLTVAAVMYGDELEPFRPQITRAVDDMEGDYEIMLRDWDGDIDKLKVLGRYVKDLIDGRYA